MTMSVFEIKFQDELQIDGPGIETIMEIDLIPRVELSEAKYMFTLSGILMLKGRYKPITKVTKDIQGFTLPWLAKKNDDVYEKFNKSFPIRVIIPVDRVEVKEDVSVYVDDLDYEIKNNTTIAVSCKVVVDGIIPQQVQAHTNVDENNYDTVDEDSYNVVDEENYNFDDEDSYNVVDEENYNVDDEDSYNVLDEDLYNIDDEDYFTVEDEDYYNVEDEGFYNPEDEDYFNTEDGDYFNADDVDYFSVVDKDYFSSENEDIFYKNDELYSGETYQLSYPWNKRNEGGAMKNNRFGQINNLQETANKSIDELAESNKRVEEVIEAKEIKKNDEFMKTKEGMEVVKNEEIVEAKEVADVVQNKEAIEVEEGIEAEEVVDLEEGIEFEEIEEIEEAVEAEEVQPQKLKVNINKETIKNGTTKEDIKDNGATPQDETSENIDERLQSKWWRNWDLGDNYTAVKYYIIKENDNINVIAEHFKVSRLELISVNKNLETGELYPGMRIRIPTA